MINIKEEIKEIEKESKEIRSEIVEKISGYMLAALGLVAALAWNDAIKSLIDYFFPIDKGSMIIKFLYAVIITLIVVIVSYYLTKFLQRKKLKSSL